MTEASANDTVIKATALSHHFGKKRALDNLDLEFTGQGVSAILGSNGAGKTTFVHCVLGLLKPGTGTIKVFGREAGVLSNRQRTGAMLQDADLPDLLTAREHIELFASYYPNPLTTEELLQKCEIGTFADTRYKKLSGGQKRRVQFALALVGQPALIFLDEPTTGLDVDARRTMWKIIRELADSGKKIILTTHYLEEADALADQIVVMHAGRVIADASAAQIRDRVGGALIRCVSQLSDATLTALPAVPGVKRSGRFVELLSTDATQTLQALLQADRDLTELTVKKPNLEEAFLEIINQPATSSTGETR